MRESCNYSLRPINYSLFSVYLSFQLCFAVADSKHEILPLKSKKAHRTKVGQHLQTKHKKLIFNNLIEKCKKRIGLNI